MRKIKNSDTKIPMNLIYIPKAVTSQNLIPIIPIIYNKTSNFPCSTSINLTIFQITNQITNQNLKIICSKIQILISTLT